MTDSFAMASNIVRDGSEICSTMERDKGSWDTVRLRGGVHRHDPRT